MISALQTILAKIWLLKFQCITSKQSRFLHFDWFVLPDKLWVYCRPDISRLHCLMEILHGFWNLYCLCLGWTALQSHGKITVLRSECWVDRNRTSFCNDSNNRGLQITAPLMWSNCFLSNDCVSVQPVKKNYCHFSLIKVSLVHGRRRGMVRVCNTYVCAILPCVRGWSR